MTDTIFSPAEWTVLNFCEEYHMKNHRFPTVAMISKRSGVLTEHVVRALSNPRLQKAFEARGIDWLERMDKSLTEKQLATIQLLYNFSDERSKAQKLAAIGVKASQLQGWRRTANFAEAEKQIAEGMWGQAMPEIHAAVVQGAIDGDIQKQKLAYAIMGRWDEKKNEAAINVSNFLKQVFEVLAEEVGDVHTLERIAKRFDGLTGGLSPIQGQLMSGDE